MEIYGVQSYLVMVISQSIDEKVLLQRLREGDERAFEQLYALHSPRIYGNILKLVHSRDQADDLLQELFLKVWDKRTETDPEKSFKSFLFTCSRNLVYDFLRRIKLENQIACYLTRANSELYEHVEEQVFFLETQGQLQQLISQLPPQRQKIYKLCKIEGHSYEETAAMLGLSTSTIHDHIVKANRFIKERLTKTAPAIRASVVLSLLFFNLG